MTPEYWQKVKSLLEEVIEVEPAARNAFLKKACLGDDVFQREVESFLKFDEIDIDPLENPAFSFAEQDDGSNNGTSYVGKEIGPYRIIRVLGSGGMGMVFLAERSDGEFDQKVALKLIKRGMDSDAVLRRFYNERRILASLVHPNIAHLLDGGTTPEGGPYFVMEYVEGRPILEYAESKKLNIEDKLRLFREVASAVSFAHQNLIIHRDLKPSNILVNADGKPKLLDFGIAKLLTAGVGSLATATQQFVLTPDYASPEQVRGEQLTTVTDVYSLGVVLYELLTGTRLYKTGNQSFGDIIRVVCETVPVAPSRLHCENASKLKGDLDNIILKALRKEPERRYASVEQFSEDIRRHLENIPIVAGVDSWSYRMQKFITRNRYIVVTAALIIVTLLGGLGATFYQANIARRERAKAEQRFADVRQLANSFMFEINEMIVDSPIKARELLVTRAIEYLDKLSQEPEGDTDLQAELATAYEKIGQVQAELFNPGLGKTSDALASHQKSLQIRERLFGLDKSSVARGLDVIKSRLLVGDIYSMSGKIVEARGEYQAAIVLGEELSAIASKSREVKSDLSRSYARLGQNVLRSGSLGNALENYERSLQITRGILAEDPEELQRQHSLAIIYNYIGYVKIETLEFAEASRYFRNELEIDEKILATEPASERFRASVSEAHMWLGLTTSEEGKTHEALYHLQTALSMQKAISDADPANLGGKNSVADCLSELARVLAKEGNYDAALKAFGEADKNYSEVWKSDPENISAKRQIALTHRRMADTLTQKGETKKAFSLYRQTLDEYQVLIQNDPDNTEWRDDLAICQLRTGENLLKQRNFPEAELHLRQASEIFEKLVTASPENARLRRDFEVTKSYLGRIN